MPQGTRPHWRFIRQGSATGSQVTGATVKLPDSFTIRDLAATISKLLELTPGSNIEIQRDRLDRNRILVIKRDDETTGG